MGEKSGPVPEVICVIVRFFKSYSHRLFRPFTVRLNKSDLPGSPQAASSRLPP